MSSTGTVKWFDDAKGFGFVRLDECEGDDIDVFVHYKEIEGTGHRTLTEGQAVTLDVVSTPKGLAARKLKLAEVYA